MVRRSHPQPDFTFLGTGPGTRRAAGNSADRLATLSAGDQYFGLDSFGRVIDHHWKTTGGTTDRFAYTYDRNSNRLTKDNAVNSDFDEAYTYDSLNQLTGFDRNSGDRTQAWDFDALSNWDSLTTDGGSPQTRTHNKQNEITAVSGATTPTFDANGNMTTDETGKQYVYDAWNRLKVVKNSGGTTLKTYVYDALNRRVTETAGGTTTDFYYSANWQVLEERDTARTNDTKTRYVWSPVYVDAMVLRDRDTADDGTLEERLWVQQDVNFNVTALVDNNGDVVERFVYDPYGVVTVLDETWSVIGSSAYGWLHLHQGGRLDTTSGLYHFRNRDFSPTLGRWATMDPARYAGGDNNLYSFVGNSPNEWNDPTGTVKRISRPSDLEWRDFDITAKPSFLDIPNPGAAVLYKIFMDPPELEISDWRRPYDLNLSHCIAVTVKVTKVTFYLGLVGAWSRNRETLTEQAKENFLNHERGHIANGLYVVRRYNEALAEKIRRGWFNHVVIYCPKECGIVRNYLNFAQAILDQVYRDLKIYLEEANQKAAYIDSEMYDSPTHPRSAFHGQNAANQERWNTNRDVMLDELFARSRSLLFR